jgi:hypothetical protein
MRHRGRGDRALSPAESFNETNISASDGEEVGRSSQRASDKRNQLKGDFD